MKEESLMVRHSNLRKTNLLLKALDESGKDVDYYALDLSLSELDRTLSANPPGTFRHLKCYGLYGTYDDGLEWLKLPRNRFRPKVVMSMGSSIGNMERQQGATFLRSFASLLQPSDMMLVGVDGCLDKQKVYPAYNDKEGVTHEFYRNGLRHANTVLGFDLFKQDDWEIVGEFDEHYGRHQAFVSPRKDVDSHGFSFVAGERIRLENSYKYSRAQRSTLWSESGLTLKVSYADKLSHYCKWAEHFLHRLHRRSQSPVLFLFLNFLFVRRLSRSRAVGFLLWELGKQVTGNCNRRLLEQQTFTFFCLGVNLRCNTLV